MSFVPSNALAAEVTQDSKAMCLNFSTISTYLLSRSNYIAGTKRRLSNTSAISKQSKASNHDRSHKHHTL
jgi:hypothetical protein